MLLVWLYVAVHGLVPLASSSAPADWPAEWREAAGELAAEGTPHAVFAASNLRSPEVNTGT
jgi:hypothetical protein